MVFGPAYGLGHTTMAKKSDSDAPAAGRGRISLPLAPDGSGFAWEQMRPSTKRALFDAVMADPRRIYEEVGEPIPGDTDDPTATAEPDLFGGLTLENVRAGLDILSQINVLAFKMVAPRIVKHPFKRHPATGKPLPLVIDPDILQSAFALTDKQHAELDPRALKVANKYSHKMPAWMRDNLDLVMLGTMYVRYTGENAVRAIKTQVVRDLAAAKAEHERRTKPQPDDTDKPPVRITEADAPATETVPTYPEPAAGNGGMVAEL